jgi:hypothetical protein
MKLRDRLLAQLKPVARVLLHLSVDDKGRLDTPLSVTQENGHFMDALTRVRHRSISVDLHGSRRWIAGGGGGAIAA